MKYVYLWNMRAAPVLWLRDRKFASMHLSSIPRKELFFQVTAPQFCWPTLLMIPCRNRRFINPISEVISHKLDLLFFY